MQAKACSSDSQLARLFAARAGKGVDTPREAMKSLVEHLCKDKKASGRPAELEPLLHCRRILDIEYAEVACDGFIKPLGTAFDDGFRMVISNSVPNARRRFTMAHELCHTFFYELVPELKFRPHETDEAEETLCNYGAAVLLMPEKSIRREAKKLPVSIDSLDFLANRFAVSLEAMALRLRDIHAWHTEISTWKMMTNGAFGMERIRGGRRLAWRWLDDEPLRESWATGKAQRGRAFVEHTDESGNRYIRPLSFEVERRGNRLVVLWGRGVTISAEGSPLFHKPKRRASPVRALAEGPQ